MEEFILCLLSAVIGGLGRAPGKIRMKSIGTSKTVMCFKKMMYTGADMGEWVGWLVTPLLRTQINDKDCEYYDKNTGKHTGQLLHFYYK